MKLSSYARKMTLLAPTLLLDGSSENASVDLYGKYGARVNFNVQKNMIAVEPSFLCFIAGIWEQPNSLQIYGVPTTLDSDKKITDYDTAQGVTATDSAGFRITRYRGTEPSQTLLDRGAPKDIELFRNANAWLADPVEQDPIGDIGSRASINYWLNGGVSFDYDYDPIKIAATSSGVVRQVESHEGGEGFPCMVDFHCGAATLQHFPDA